MKYNLQKLLANQKSNRRNNDLVRYEYNDLRYKIDSFERYYSSKKEFKEFLLEILYTAENPYYIESGFIRSFNRYHHNSFVISKDELKGLSLFYYEEFCKKNDSINSYFWHLYQNCRQTNSIPLGDNRSIQNDFMPNEAKEICINFIVEKDTDGFFLAIIDPEIHDKKIFSINPIVVEIFEDWDGFKAFLESIDESNSKYVYVFRSFYDEFATKNHSSYVPFEFRSIPISKKFKS